MSTTYDNTNRGALFVNDKQGNEKRPDYSGKLNVAGKEYRLVGWKRQGARGPFLSLQVDEPRPPLENAPAPASVRQAAPARATSEAEPFNDEIPF